VPGGHVVLRLSDLSGLRRTAVFLDVAAPDEDALTLQVPSDGSVRSLRALLDRLDSASVEVEELSVHTPDLDDVFLALTGQADISHLDKQKETAR
jgi:ABC-2 type transport system ATP-binding protein